MKTNLANKKVVNLLPSSQGNRGKIPKSLIDKVRSIKMSPQDREDQRRSFAYGNTKIENDQITRNLIDDAANKMVELL